MAHSIQHFKTVHTKYDMKLYFRMWKHENETKSQIAIA